MFAIFSLLTIITISILVTRIATVALAHTGLSRETARFQARSAFTGAGFTTSESESVVNHPVRRQIVLLLMLLGNAGIVTAVTSLILTFVNNDQSGLSSFWRLTLLVSGLLVLWTVAHSSFVDRHLNRWISSALRKYTSLDVRDYASLMHLEADYRLVELLVEPDDWVAGQSLAGLELRDEGIIVLGVKRLNGIYIGAPNGDTCIEPEDTMILYGRGGAIEQLDKRRRSMTAEARHDRAVLEQKRLAAIEAEEQKLRDEEAPSKSSEAAREDRIDPNA